VIHNFSRLIKRQRNLNFFQRTFSQLTLVLPFVILAEGVLSGRLEVGRAIQAAGAFTAVLAAVGIIVDNLESLSRFVAGIGRLQALSNLVLLGAEPKPAAGDKPPCIQMRRGEHLALEALTLHPPQSERVLIKELSLVVKPGDALLITGDSGCGKSSLLRAIAGLWNTGSGVIHHPPMEDFFSCPSSPTCSLARCAASLSTPARSQAWTTRPCSPFWSRCTCRTWPAVLAAWMPCRTGQSCCRSANSSAWPLAACWCTGRAS
jgi:putative ATP-binding cassette transporter